MSPAPIGAEELLRRLPLPLAQTFRRAHNAKTAIDRHHNAYYLAEATLKLAASLRIGVALEAGLDDQSPLARSLEQLCLPSVGHWVGFLRDASEYLARRPDAALLPLATTHDALTRHDAFAAVQAFAERASTAVDGEDPPISPETARVATRQGILGFFNLVAAYRNQVFGHAAQRPPAFYDDLGSLLLGASAEILRQDALFGGLTLAVARLSMDAVRVEWQGLQGFASLMLLTDAVGPEPDPSEESARKIAGRVSFVGQGLRVSLHPLVVYHEDRSERERVGFLNRTVEAGRSGEVRRCDYLDYTTGDHIREVDPRRDLTALLARLRGRPASEGDVERIILESQAGSGEGAPSSPLATGATIGDFELQGELGRGGMGVVYRARQRSLNRTVALKVLPPSLAADPVSLARFRREIAALGRSEHPNLVKILTSGADGDRHYYAMELVEGMDLAALFEVLSSWNRSARGRLREGHLPAAVSTSSQVARRRQEQDASNRDPQAEAEPLPELEPIPAPTPELESGRTLYECLGTLFADAAGALAHLHSRGVIHRDVKPANLMLTQDGRRLVVMDLGLAQLRDRSQSLTAAGDGFLGTLRYISPEQLQQNLLEVDERTDVYGLGATLYEMATLAPLFDGDTKPRLIEQVLHQEPKTPRTVAPEIPRDLAAIALHCLDKDRSQRYANVRDLADDLRRFANGEAVSVREPGPAEKVMKWARRKPTLAAAYALSLTVVILTAFGISLAVLWQDAVRAKDIADFQKKTAEQARELAEGERKNALEASKALDIVTEKLAAVEYGRSMQVAHQEWRDNNVAASLALMDGTRPELRGWEWKYLRKLCHDELLEFKGHIDRVSSFSWNPDGTRFATASGDETAIIRDAKTGKELHSLEGHAETIRSLSWSPDGTRIATASDDKTARIWDARTGDVVVTLKGHTDVVNSVSWSPDGSRIATESQDLTARIWDAKTGKSVHTINGNTDLVKWVAWSPDGLRIATSGWDETARIWDAKTEDLDVTLVGHTESVNKVSWSPDGTLIATASNDKTARIWDAKTGDVVFTLEGHSDSINSAEWSPDGSRIATASDDKTARIWDAKTGDMIVTLTGHTNDINSVTWSSDGSRIATASDDKTARIWDAKTGGLASLLKGHTTPVFSVSWSPDGTRVATESGDNTTRIWDATSGSEPVTLQGHTNVINSVSWSPDGTRIVTASLDHTARIWDATNRTAPLTLQGHTVSVNSGSWSPDGSHVATASSDKTARIWDAKTGDVVVTLEEHNDFVKSVSWSPDGTRIATASDDKTARIWDAKTGKELHSLEGHADAIRSLSWSPDGTHIATASSDKTARIWDAKTGDVVVTLNGHTNVVKSIAWSPDGLRIATASWDETAWIWDAKTGDVVRTLKGHSDYVNSVSWSPDGTRIATAGGNETARVWDTRTWAEPLILKGHTDSISEIFWSPDGTRIATASWDETARIWDAKTGAETLTLKGHTGSIRSVSWHPDGSRIVTASDDHTARVWDARNGVERAAAGR